MEDPFIRQARTAVSSYLGVPVPAVPVTVLDDSAFDRAYNTFDDRLFGGVGAITLPSREIVLPRRHRADLVHELVHVAFGHEVGVSEPVNEGVTQVAAEEIARKMKVRVRKTYADEVRYIRTRVIPATGMGVQAFLKGYARSPDKGEYLAEKIWRTQKRHFTDPDEWGAPDRARAVLQQDFRRGLGRYDPWTDYLHEVGAI
jgi:ribosomal protein L31E